MIRECSARPSADCSASRRRSSARRSGRGNRSSWRPASCDSRRPRRAWVPVLRSVSPSCVEQWSRLRGLTDRPFAINHTNRPFDEAAFDATLEAAPARDLVPHGRARRPDRPRPRGRHPLDPAGRRPPRGRGVRRGRRRRRSSPRAARRAGTAADVSTMVLVPQVVDVAGDIPVVAAGGIADGRGLAAALALGAQGVLHGHALPRLDGAWDRRRVEAPHRRGRRARRREGRQQRARDAALHTTGAARSSRERCSTPLIEQLRDAPGLGRPERRSGPRIREALLAGRGDEYLPFAGQSVGLIDEVLPAAEIVRRVVAEAEAARVP